MATSSYVKSLLGGLDASLKTALGKVSEYVLDGNLRFGPITHQTRTENFAGVYLVVTTAAVANTEFTVAHGLGAKPRVIWPVLDPQSLGSRIVPLEVSRIADEARVYLKSSDKSAGITLYMEA